MATQVTKVRDEEARMGTGPSPLAPGPDRRLAEFFRRIWQKLTEYPRRFRQFLHEVRAEMHRVTWPTWTDVRATTAVVIATVFFFGVFLFLIDFGASQIVERVLKFFRP